MRPGCLAALVLLGCGHGPSPALIPARAAEAPPSPSGGCDPAAVGLLKAHSGGLWFEGQGEGGAVHAETLLTALHGSYSTLLPQRDPARFFAVRTGPVQRTGTPPDALVQLDPSSLRTRELWSPGGRLWLLGRSAGRPVLLVEDVAGLRAAAVAPDGVGATFSEPLELAPEATAGPRPEVPLPHAAPLGEDRLLLRCQGGRLCLLTVGKERLEVTRLGVRAEAIGLLRGGLVLRRAHGRCVFPEDRPPQRWARLRARPCPREADFAPVEPGLPVEGVLSAGAPARVGACLLRTEIELPPLRDGSRRPAAEPPPAHGGAGVALLPLSAEVPGDLSLDLLVRGRTLALGFRASGGAQEAARPRDFAVALPPGTVQVRPVELAGRSVYHVRVRARVPLDPSPGCWTGRLVVRVGQPAGGAPEQVLADRGWAFGACAARTATALNGE